VGKKEKVGSWQKGKSRQLAKKGKGRQWAKRKK